MLSALLHCASYWLAYFLKSPIQLFHIICEELNRNRLHSEQSVLTIVRRTIVLWGSCGATLLVLLIFLYLCYMDGFCPHYGPVSAIPVSGGATGDYDSGPCADQDISSSRWIRLAVFLTSVALIASSAVITLVNCLQHQRKNVNHCPHAIRGQLGSAALYSITKYASISS